MSLIEFFDIHLDILLNQLLIDDMNISNCIHISFSVSNIFSLECSNHLVDGISGSNVTEEFIA